MVHRYLLAVFLMLSSRGLKSSSQSTIVSTVSSISVSSISPSSTTLVSAPSSAVTSGNVSPQKGGEKEEEVEYPGYDGWYNNRAHPEWGVVDSPLTRRIPSAYEDGVYRPSGNERPNPFVVSEKIMNGSTGLSSRFNRTALLVFFGQQVVEEILDAQRPGCPPEYFNIEIPKGHEKFDKEASGDKAMPFIRSRYDMKTGTSPNNPRQQLNEITPFIDGGLMYGTSKAWADALRSFKDGKLAKSEHGDWPQENELGLPMANPPPPAENILKESKRFFKLGNPRGNENPFLLSFGILWFRWHNVLAERIKQKHSDWKDEKIFNEARKWVIATHQQIVLYEWLPDFLNLNHSEMAYEGYKPAVHPGITHVFQSAAMRFGHTMVPPGVYRRNAKCVFRKTTLKSSAAPNSAHKFGVRTCNSFWNPQLPISESDIEEFLMGMATQVAEREDNIITPDLRGNVFGPLEFSRRDLMAINIQRARDHGLPDYNTARLSYGLERRESFAEINKELYESSDEEGEQFREIIQKLNDTYKGDIDSVDVWPGGLLESNSKNSPGELFRTIIKDQFLRIRDGDRFWFENYKQNGLFTEEEVNEIKKITIWDVIVNCTDIPPDAIQRQPFHIEGSPCLENMPVPLTPRAEDMEECTKLEMFDYFSGSEVSFALTFLFSFLFLVGMVVLLFVLSKRREKEASEQKKLLRMKTRKSKKMESNAILATEWQGAKDPDRSVKVKLGPKTFIFVQSERGQNFRTIELKQMKWILLFSSSDRGRSTLILRMEREYDLVLKFDSEEMKVMFVSELGKFLKQPDIDIQCKESEMKESDMLRTAVTKKHRQQVLEKFFRVAFAHAFDIQHEEDNETSEFEITMDKVNDVLNCELSKAEFADALSLKPNSLFVNQMFELVDKDKNGFLSFREFLDVIVIFAKGGIEEKLRLFFDMYDVDGLGTLTRDDFKKMIKSFMDLVSADVESSHLDELVNSMFSEAGFENKNQLTFEDFSQVMGDHKDELEGAQLNLAGTGVNVPKSSTLAAQKQTAPNKKTVIRRENAPTRARKTVMRAYKVPELEASETDKPISNRTPSGRSIKIKTKKSMYSNSRLVQKWIPIRRYVENHRLQIFYFALYMFVLLGIFVERAYYYSVEREHVGLRRIAGYGVTVTRGAASAMMFTYSLLLITMCRNTITFLRSTVIHQWVPFDSAIAFHKIIALSALVFTVMHSIGHAINFYHIATQTANDLSCLFRDFFHLSHELPKFHNWCWQTITGLTGVLLLLMVIVMFIFATQYARRHVFGAFWFTHSMYILLYILMVLHGSGNLVQPPYFQYFFIGPGVLFTIDKLISLSRKKAEISVVKAELLPSDVTHLEFKRPTNFEYMSGQWVRIACAKLAGSEYHPFTLTSSPHEETLSLHIRAVGPWTINIRRTYDPSFIRDSPYPKLFLDGPFGEGHQDWYRFEVAVLVGGGIGVTPFASILKDIVHKATINATFNCKRYARELIGTRILQNQVYFLWVTRTQKHFEWLTDIIREVEEKDKKDLVTVHIFVTQFYQKFDLRTTMLYICERHFQKISGRSLFTGLRSITHFGRPEFNSFLSSLEEEHPKVSKIGVFSCGPPTMTRNVEQACADLNKSQGAAFIHHFENF